MVILIASWDRYRFPIAIAPLDPEIKGHQNLLFRHMRKTFKPPSWVRQVVVSADAGFAANQTLQLIDARHWTYVFAMPRRRKFTNGKSLRDLVRHWPKSCYHRRASAKPDGRRRDDWVFRRRATLNRLGDVTIVRSKKRRNDGPKQVKLFVTNLTEARAGAILSEYAWRWAVGVSRQGHTIQSVKVRPRRKDSGLVAWEAPWRENKTVEPSDNMLRKEHAQHTRL
jgi:hypothetical protein